MCGSCESSKAWELTGALVARHAVGRSGDVEATRGGGTHALVAKANTRTPPNDMGRKAHTRRNGEKCAALHHSRHERRTKEDWGGSLQSAPMTDPEPGGLGARRLNGASCRRRPHPAPAGHAGPRARRAKADHDATCASSSRQARTGRANAATPRPTRESREDNREELTEETANDRRTAEFRAIPVSRAAGMDARENAIGFHSDSMNAGTERALKTGRLAGRRGGEKHAGEAVDAVFDSVTVRLRDFVTLRL